MSNKKRILIFTQAMELGGAETALLGLLENIDPAAYSVDLFLMRHQGELLPYIPSYVNLLPEDPNYSCLAVPIARVIKRGKLGIALGRLRSKQVAAKRVKELHLGGNNAVELEASHRFTRRYMPQIGEGEYDLCISFLTPHWFARNKVRAKKYLAWIHTDYSTVEVDAQNELPMWAAYDHIASISPAVTESFLKTFPSLESKIVLIENILPVKYIKAMACKDVTKARADMPADGAFRILSIGRFSPPKAFDRVPQICVRLRERGLNVKWYLIGYGGDEALIGQRIAEAGMQDYVIILGKRANPYPYIKECDLYAQPSRYEGKSVAVREAQALGRPVVITNYPTARDQLQDGIDGIIVPQDLKGCVEGFGRIIEDRKIRQFLITNIANGDFSESKNIEQIYKIVEI